MKNILCLSLFFVPIVAGSKPAEKTITLSGKTAQLLYDDMSEGLEEVLNPGQYGDGYTYQKIGKAMECERFIRNTDGKTTHTCIIIIGGKTKAR